ncbi:hypothetical protein DL96DRAFT_214404 [Flagelloscypha sp. PMI_526]|nr:hypothetical protein DL96DRAFT_214404 [Flagelloscypha sp. PMI_526]
MIFIMKFIVVLAGGYCDSGKYCSSTNPVVCKDEGSPISTSTNTNTATVTTYDTVISNTFISTTATETRSDTTITTATNQVSPTSQFPQRNRALSTAINKPTLQLAIASLLVPASFSLSLPCLLLLLPLLVAAQSPMLPVGPPGVPGQHGPAALLEGRYPGTGIIEGLLGRRFGLDQRQLSCPSGWYVCYARTDATCCPTGGTCCAAADPNNCCDPGYSCSKAGCCKTSERACGTGCIPQDADCCNGGGGYCAKGSFCQGAGCSNDAGPVSVVQVTATVTTLMYDTVVHNSYISTTLTRSDTTITTATTVATATTGLERNGVSRIGEAGFLSWWSPIGSLLFYYVL